MDDNHEQKTAFTCHAGLISWNVMHFGLINAQAIFNELIATVLSGLNFALANSDEILIWSNSVEEHLDPLQQVFDRLREHKLKLKLKKC